MQKGNTQTGRLQKVKDSKEKGKKQKKSNHHGYRCIFIEDIFKCAKQEQEQ